MLNTSTISMTPAEVSGYYAALVPHLQRRGVGWCGQCPIHLEALFAGPWMADKK
jgi:hypothetical protein